MVVYRAILGGGGRSTPVSQITEYVEVRREYREESYGGRGGGIRNIIKRLKETTMDYLYFCAEFIYKKILPPWMRIRLMRFMDYNRYKLRRDIVRFLETEVRQKPDMEKETVLKILRKNPVYMIPYIYDYVPPLHKITVYDDGHGNKYVVHDGKKLFFPVDWSAFQIKMTYTSLMREQNIKSPHRYETEDFCVKDGDVIADCGAAEGIWALSSAEKAGKIYIFECEKKWIDALEKTFAPWSGKVEIVNKFVSDVDSSDSVTLDKFGGGGDKFHKSGHRRR
jgi:hypothetical protein